MNSSLIIWRMYGGGRGGGLGGDSAGKNCIECYQGTLFTTLDLCSCFWGTATHTFLQHAACTHM
jgi:hypothetical protein